MIKIVRSFYLLLQASKQIRVEELVDGNTQTITQLFNSRYRCTVVSSANDIIHSGLRNAANAAQLVD